MSVRLSGGRSGICPPLPPPESSTGHFVLSERRVRCLQILSFTLVAAQILVSYLPISTPWRHRTCGKDRGRIIKLLARGRRTGSQRLANQQRGGGRGERRGSLGFLAVTGDLCPRFATPLPLEFSIGSLTTVQWLW